MSQPVRVLLAEDNDVYAETVAELLGADPRIRVVDRARDGAEAVTLALRLRPHLVLMDLDMPVLDGVEATRRIRERCPDIRVVALTSSTDPDAARRIRLVGGSGFLRKDCPLDELAAAVVDAPGLPSLPPRLDLASWMAA
jgi:DNA-binding NarL/FixJ family response regulator